MKRFVLPLLCALTFAGVACARDYIITTKPSAIIVVKSAATGQTIGPRYHLSSIESNTVNGVQTITVTVTP